MLTEALHARHIAELGFLEQALAESGLQVNLLEKSEEVPLHILLAALENDHKDRERFVNFSFVPIPENELEEIQLLQLYTLIPCDRKTDKSTDVGKLLLAINCRLAIGHFSMKDDGDLYYRYVHCAPKTELIHTPAFLEMVSLFLFMLEMFSKLIDDVYSGRISLAAALLSFE